MKQGPQADPAGILARARVLLGQKLHDAAWQSLSAAPESPERCALQVEILIGRLAHGDLDAALKLVKRWRELAPRSAEPWSRALEIALHRQDQAAMDQALAQLRRIAPGHPRTLFYQGLHAQLAGRISDALQHYAAAAKLQFPNYSLSTTNVMAASKAFDASIGNYPGSHRSDTLLALGHPETCKALETSLESWSRESSTTEGKEQLLAALAWDKLGSSYSRSVIDVEKCLGYFDHALGLNPGLEKARRRYLFVLNFDDARNPEEIGRLHSAHGDWWAGRFPERQKPWSNSRSVEKTLRVGYLSCDFRNHSVAFFILPVLQRHDSRQVLSHVYHAHATRDEYTERAAQAAYQFRHVFDLDDAALAAQIERDGIDILVDLNGHTGHGRTSLLARRAAPIQMTWIGYPNTTGLPTVDYRIVDDVTDPPATAQAWNRERLLYLPKGFSVYDPLTELPPLTSPPCARNGHVTFGCFNNVVKINPARLRTWGKILARLPDARLLIKYPTLDLEPVRRELHDLLQQQGVDVSRVTLMGRIPGRENHLESYAMLDLQLDTYPYHGTTTTCESLLMGVPVVTRAGPDHRSRVGASLLTSVGHPEWVAADENEYIEIAVRLASSPEALAATRSALRDRVRSSALMDAPGFVRGLEQAYRECWIDWCRKGDHGADQGRDSPNPFLRNGGSQTR